jgi:hypothetical protein
LIARSWASSNAVAFYIDRRDPLDGGKLLGEDRQVVACLTLGRGVDELLVGEATVRADGVASR